MANSISKPAESNERRFEKRYKVEPGTLFLKDPEGNFVSGFLIDISTNGLSAIFAADIFENDQTLTSNIEWAGGSLPVNGIKCVVKNKSVLKRKIGFQNNQKKYYRYGMHFVSGQEDQRFEVQNCIHYHTVIEA